MSLLNMSKNIKEIHKEYVCLYKVGTFYRVYGKDAYIISYLFGYNVKIEKENIYSCGFPTTALARIMSKLDMKKVNYITLDVRNEYDVDYKQDNGNLNTYNEILEKSTRYVKLKRRVDEITIALLENLEKDDIKEKIRKIEDIIYEDREI